MWYVGDPVRFVVPLRSADGWEWLPADPELSWWVSCHGVWCADEEVIPEHVTVPAARVTTSRCLPGPLVAHVVCKPLSLALVAPEWELDMAITYASVYTT